MGKRVIKLKEEGCLNCIAITDSDDTEYELDDNKVVIRSKYNSMEYDEGLGLNTERYTFSLVAIRRSHITDIDLEWMEDKQKWIVSIYAHMNKMYQIFSDGVDANKFYNEMLEWAFE